MPNVVALVKDDRVRRQIEVLLNELDVDDVRFATFNSVADFQDLYFRDRSDQPEPEPPPEGTASEETEGAELKLFSEVHLLIFALDTIVDKPMGWINKLRANLKKFKCFPATDFRLVMLKYEDDGISKLDVMHPFLDDLIYLPLDRLIFLQKLQILLTLPKRVSPTYLFNQEVAQNIEISKITKLDRLSDVGLAIRNPVPLKKGLPGHFYLTFPGEKNRLEIKAKVFRSEPHPEHPGQYLVYFSYFGLTKNALTALRRALSKSPQYRSFVFDDRQRFRFEPDDMFLDDAARHQFGTIIIDSDEYSGTSLSQTLNKEMDRLDVVVESSFSLFMHRYFDNTSSGSKDNTPPKATDTADFYSPTITLTLSTHDLKVLMVDPGPADSSMFLGHSALAIFSSSEKWLSLIQEKESRLVIEESAKLVKPGRTLEKLISMQNAHNQRCAVTFRITRGTADGTLNIEIAPASLGDIINKLQSEHQNKSLEAMIVDTAFVPEEPSNWIEAIRKRAAQKALIQDGNKLKFWFITESENVSTTLLNTPDVLGLFIKPVDQRQLLFSLSENLGNKNTLYNFENLGWSHPGLNIHVSKDVQLEALSEFGATLKTRQMLAPGSIVYLRKSIYENAPNGCLAARIYSCEEDPNEAGLYRAYTTYFGINDAFLKFARTWIRENYANQKAQGSGGGE